MKQNAKNIFQGLSASDTLFGIRPGCFGLRCAKGALPLRIRQPFSGISLIGRFVFPNKPNGISAIFKK
ncbi:MAG: hypothetical protein N2747_04465 [Chitinophagaceae bacterium]|nr:hypothetical protein [Chitinophagaceae bacterium]